MLERLRYGAKVDDLVDKERVIFDDGLVVIPKEMHDRMDAADAEAYGLPTAIDEEAVLANLVALNKARTKEEKRGLVHWLRSDFQVPRLGSDMEKAEQIEADLGDGVAAHAASKPTFPADERDQTPAVLHQLLEAEEPLNSVVLAGRFKQGQRARKSVEAVLASLHRMGIVSTNDSKFYSFRRVA